MVAALVLGQGSLPKLSVVMTARRQCPLLSRTGDSSVEVVRDSFLLFPLPLLKPNGTGSASIKHEQQLQID